MCGQCCVIPTVTRDTRGVSLGITLGNTPSCSGSDGNQPTANSLSLWSRISQFSSSSPLSNTNCPLFRVISPTNIKWTAPGNISLLQFSDQQRLIMKSRVQLKYLHLKSSHLLEVPLRTFSNQTQPIMSSKT